MPTTQLTVMKSPNRLETLTGQNDRLSVCTLNGSAKLWRSQYKFYAFVIFELDKNIYNGNLEIAQTNLGSRVCAGKFQDALRITYMCRICIP